MYLNDDVSPVSKQEALDDAIQHFDGDEMAGETFLRKYAVQLPQDEVDGEARFLETKPEDMWERMAKEGASVEDNPGKWKDKFSNAFKDWKVVPQGSIMFSLGNPHQKSSASNCFVIPVQDDSLEGIFDTAKEIARTYSYRGGVGTDISLLRPKGSVVHNCSRESTGAVSFMDFYSYITNLIGQNGRRGALMLTISDSHPDLYHPETDGMDFINIKRDLDKVTGANISVRISDAFMRAVRNNEEWELSWQRFNNCVYVGGEYIGDSEGPDIEVKRSYPAREIWDNTVESATESAEPGVLFWDRVKEQSPADQYSDEGFETTCTNPCVPGNTWVFTNHGPKKIEDIEGRSIGINVDGSVYQSEEGSFVTGHKDCYRIKTDRGYEFEATGNHRIKVDNGYKSVDELSVGEDIKINNPKESEWSGHGNYDKGWLLGFYIGDGVVSDKVKSRIPLYDKKKKLFDKINSIVQELGVRSDFKGKEHGNKIIVKTACLQELANDFGIGSERRITDEIQEASSEFYKGFLSGYFDADGTVLDADGCRKSVRLSSVDLDVLKDVQRMLLRLGVVSTVYENRADSGTRLMPDGKGGKKEYDCQAVHELIISKKSIVKFHEKVGFDHPDKQDKLFELVDSYSRGPYSDSFEAEVESIEKTGTKQVYDISVEDKHEFSANGIRVHNCSEIPLSNYDACTLLSINLTEFVKNPFTENPKIDGSALKDHIETATRFLDNVKELDADKVPLDKQAEVAMKGRRIGIGTHGLADMLAMLGLEYDSDEAIEQCDKLYDFIKNKVYQSSAKLADEKGTFPIYDEDKHFQSPFIQRLNSKTKSMIKENGLRNIACLTLAPTGTVSMLSQTSSGIEPIFRLQYERNVRTGGEAETFEVNHHLVDEYLNTVPEANDVSDLPDYFQTVKDIDYVKRTELQGVIQKHIDHAISNTINIPADVDDPEKIVSDSYFKAWEEGCKGYTVYVDGSREEAPLQSGEQEPHEVSDDLEYKADSKVWEASDDYGHYFITEGQDQIFINGYSSTAGRLNPATIELADNVESVLKAHVDESRVEKYVERAGFDSIEKVARLVSLALKTNNADKVKVFLEQFSGRTSLATRLNEIFEYRKIKQTDVCPECHSDNVKHSEGCLTCLDCGNSKCSI